MNSGRFSDCTKALGEDDDSVAGGVGLLDGQANHLFRCSVLSARWSSPMCSNLGQMLLWGYATPPLPRSPNGVRRWSINGIAPKVGTEALGPLLPSCQCSAMEFSTEIAVNSGDTTISATLYMDYDLS